MKLSRGKAKVLKMHQLYMSGMTMREVASEYKCTVQYVSVAFKRYGLEARDNNGKPKPQQV